LLGTLAAIVAMIAGAGGVCVYLIRQHQPTDKNKAGDQYASRSDKATGTPARKPGEGSDSGDHGKPASPGKKKPAPDDSHSPAGKGDRDEPLTPPDKKPGPEKPPADPPDDKHKPADPPKTKDDPPKPPKETPESPPKGPVTLSCAPRMVHSLALSRDGKTLAAGLSIGGFKQPSQVILWDLARAKQKLIVEGFEQPVEGVAISPDGKTLALAGLGLRVIDLKKGKAKPTPSGTLFQASDVAFSPNGRTLAAGSSDKGITVWNVATGQARFTIKDVHSFGVERLAFALGGKVLVSTGAFSQPGKDFQGQVKLWDAATGKEQGVVNAFRQTVRALAIAPDGKTIAVGGNKSAGGEVMLLDAASGKEIKIIPGPGTNIKSVAFDPDGKVLATTWFDGGIRLYDVATAKELGGFKEPTDMATSVLFTPDGQTVITGSYDKTVKLWDCKALRKPVAAAGVR
jgi:WD40 repeat protein